MYKSNSYKYIEKHKQNIVKTYQALGLFDKVIISFSEDKSHM